MPNHRKLTYNNLSFAGPSLLLLVALLVNIGNSPIVYAQTVHHQKVDRAQDTYMLGLLKLALTYSDKNYSYVESTEVVSRARIVEQVADGNLSVMWTGASEAMEARLHPIRIPAYKGLMGYRIFIIRQGDQPRFDSVRSLEDLQQINFGQGKTWADTPILESAGLQVVKTLKIESLFHMLDGGRFDAFPRGVHEPWTEISNRPQLNLTVENSLVIKYIMPYYLFIDPNDKALAYDVEQGLEKAIADGSFDQYFYSDPQVVQALELSKLKQRRIFTINNPNLPKLTPLHRKELWLDITNLNDPNVNNLSDTSHYHSKTAASPVK